MLEPFRKNDLQPLPYRTYPVASLTDALRYMGQAKHVGKLVISMRDREGLHLEHTRPSLTIKTDSSYIITGGLGGFGLAVAQRLARRGARHLVLMGRGLTPRQATVEACGRRAWT